MARGALSGTSIAVLGLEASGAHAAAVLARSGIGRLVLVDPRPVTKADVGSWPFALPPSALGRSRARVLAGLLRRAPNGPKVLADPRRALDEATVLEVVEGAELVLACFGEGHARADLWVNRAALSSGTPALFADSAASTARLGPLVLPGKTACLTCYRMRRIACEPDFERAMEREEALDRTPRRTPPTHPALAATAGGMLATQALALFGGPPAVPLAGAVVELDGRSLTTRTSPVFARADCPSCAPKKKAASLRPHAEL